MSNFQDPPFLSRLYGNSTRIASRGEFLKKYSNRKISIRDLLIHFLGGPAKKRIIDIGSGDCTFIQRLSSTFADNSFAALDIVENSRCRAGTNIDYRVYEGGAFPSYDHLFDIVFLMHMLYHVQNHRFFFQEVKKLVADRHTIFITTKSKDTFPRIESIFQHILVSHPEIAQYMQVPTQRDEAHFCSENGAAILLQHFCSTAYTLRAYPLVTQILVDNHQDVCDYILSTPRYTLPDQTPLEIREKYQRLWLEELSYDGLFIDTYVETLYVVNHEARI